MQDYIPLREPTFFILLSLVSGPRHGYAILREVERLSEGKMRLSTGRLYGTLKRLLEQGSIVRVEEGEREGMKADGALHANRRYALTRRGRRALVAEAARLEAAVSSVQRGILEGQA